MSEKMTEKTYRIEGLSCTNCAGKFENVFRIFSRVFAGRLS